MWWSGDCAHCWAHWAGIRGILGGKIYILGVAGYDTPIWDVLALQEEREEAGEHLWGDRLLGSFPIRQAVSVVLGLAFGRIWHRFWVGKDVIKVFYTKPNVSYPFSVH